MEREITVFAKKRTTIEGKTFYSYLSTLTKKDGTQVTCSVSFRDECGAPKPEKCPCNIIIPQTGANLSRRTFTDTHTGEIRDGFTLWVSEWTFGREYVDHSLDDFI